MRWAFETLAEGIHTTVDVWKMAHEKGLSCHLTGFWLSIRNVCYCGKVLVPKYKNDEAIIVPGQHEPLISEALFYKVQDVLDGRKRDIGVESNRGIVIVSPEKLPLRGYLKYTRCNRILTGSATKGRSSYYYYYHCQSKCCWREKAKTVNSAFIEELKRFVPKPGVAELFREVVCDLFSEDSNFKKQERTRLIKGITEASNQITKARELLLLDAITVEDFKAMKGAAEEKITRLEAKLSEFTMDATGQEMLSL